MYNFYKYVNIPPPSFEAVPLRPLDVSYDAPPCGTVRRRGSPPCAACMRVFPVFFAFFCYVYANIRLGPLFCFIFKAETHVFQYKMRLPLPAVPCVVSLFRYVFANFRILHCFSLRCGASEVPTPPVPLCFFNISCVFRFFFATSTLILVRPPCSACIFNISGVFRIFCYVYANIDLGLFFVSFSRPKRLFFNIKCALFSLRSRASFQFFQTSTLIFI